MDYMMKLNEESVIVTRIAFVGGGFHVLNVKFMGDGKNSATKFIVANSMDEAIQIAHDIAPTRI